MPKSRSASGYFLPGVLLGLAASVLLLHAGCAGARRPDLAAAPDSVSTLLAAHAEARGGRAALDAVQNLEYELRIVEHGFTPAITLTGLYRIDRHGRMRIDIYQDGQRVFSEAFDGERGWQQDGKGAAEYAKPQAQANLRHGPQLPVNLLALHDLSERGTRVESLGRENLDGPEYLRLRVTLSDGFQSDYYLDPQTLLLARSRNVSALHPDLDAVEKPSETQWSDYRWLPSVAPVAPVASVAPVGGASAGRGTLRSYFSRTLDLASGREMQTVTVTALRANVALDPQLFVKP